MTTAFIIINALITIAALILCIRAWRGLRSVSKPKSRTVANLSPLERRREALELATKAWLYSVEHGLTLGEKYEREVMERLEREVAELENELFNPKAEGLATPKVETPKRKHLTTTTYGSDGVSAVYYQSSCRLCGWSWLGRSKWMAEENSAEHERSHA